MNSPLHIMVLCNNEVAIPAMQQLYMSGCLKAVVIPEKNKALFSLLKQILTGTGISMISVNKSTLESVLKKTATEKNITAAWLMTFSYVIPKSLLNLVPGGFVNFHYGLLPQYRGANPVLAQMLNGETHGGITIHTADQNIDTGPVIMQQQIAIEDKDTFGIQMHKLGILGASMATNLLQLYRLNSILPSIPQDESKAKYYCKPVAADLMINWNTMTSRHIIRLINACNPWNKGAGTMINNTGIYICDAEILEEIPSSKVMPGTIISLDEISGLKIYCFDNKVIRINVIYTPEGFFAGYRLADRGIKINDTFLSIIF